MEVGFATLQKCSLNSGTLRLYINFVTRPKILIKTQCKLETSLWALTSLFVLFFSKFYWDERNSNVP